MQSSVCAVVLSMLLLLMLLAALPQSSTRSCRRGWPLACPFRRFPGSLPPLVRQHQHRLPLWYRPWLLPARLRAKVTCNDTAARPPRLYLGNSTAQITSSISDGDNGVYVPSTGFNITMIPGVDTYIRTWEAPAKGVMLDSGNTLYVVGCNFDLYLFGDNTTDLIGACSSTCIDNNRGAMEKSNVVDGYCQGNNGCCRVSLQRDLQSFWLKLVPHDGAVAEPHPKVKIVLSNNYDYYTNDLYSSWVNSSNLDDVWLKIPITDQPSCASAQRNKDNYACSDESICTDDLPSGEGYYCSCYSRSGNNPYIRGMDA